PRNTNVFDLIKNNDNAIIFGGPGRGKTTLLHWLFCELQKQPKTLFPLLYMLRWPDAVPDLRELINGLRQGLGVKAKKLKIILLVDGYDEIDPSDRKKVSEALR